MRIYIALLSHNHSMLFDVRDENSEHTHRYVSVWGMSGLNVESSSSPIVSS